MPIPTNINVIDEQHTLSPTLQEREIRSLPTKLHIKLYWSISNGCLPIASSHIRLWRPIFVLALELHLLINTQLLTNTEEEDVST